jgi:ankyrin repeat protein
MQRWYIPASQTPPALILYYTAHWAALAGRMDRRVCELLMQARVDWTVVNNQGHTAYHKAAFKGDVQMLEWLIQVVRVPPSARAPDMGGFTPRDIAKLAGWTEAVQWIEENDPLAFSSPEAGGMQRV